MDKDKKILADDGVISLYLCLMLGVMITIILIILKAARISANGSQAVIVTDAAADSVLSEYNRDLLERYGLLFIDTSYGSGKGSVDKLIDRVRLYTGYNTDIKDDIRIVGNSLTDITADDIEITALSRATDDNGAVFRYMAISYMLQHYGYAYVDAAGDMVDSSISQGLYDGDIVKENDDAEKAVADVDLPDIEGVDWDEVDTSSHTEEVSKSRHKGILKLVCKDKISDKGVDISLYASHRNLVVGNGMYEKWPEYNDVVDELMFNEYILLKCGCKTEPVEKSVLDYEVEYVIYGYSNDNDNLKKAAERLLLIRGTANSIYFFSHGEMSAEASKMAADLAVVTLLPGLEPIYKAAIVAAWIYVESLNDVKILLSGGKVPLIKEKGDWNISLKNAMTFNLKGGGSDKGFSYKDYLRLLLYITDSEDKTKRMMDIVEMDIRNISEHDAFALDDCIAAFKVQIIYSCDDCSYLIQRSYGYW